MSFQTQRMHKSKDKFMLLASQHRQMMERSAKVITTKNDKTNKGHGKKAVAKRKVKDGTASSKGVTTKVKTSEKATTAKAVVKKSSQKPSTKTTKNSAKGEGWFNECFPKEDSSQFRKR